MQKLFFLFVILIIGESLCQSINFLEKPELFLPGLVSTEKSEIKITFSKGGDIMLWGGIGWKNGKGGWDIWESRKTGSEWSQPKPVSCNSDSNDFDPCFSADDQTLYFFSNRPGGFGGDDLYSVAFDTATKTFGEPVNMGGQFNTAGDEWGPTVSPDGKKFMYCTDGFSGKGKHDIFICNREENGWGRAENAGNINSNEDDFDPVFLNDNETIVFTRKINEVEALLFISYKKKGVYTEPVRLDSTINVSDCWNLGSSVNPAETSFLYYSTQFANNTKGRLDIYRVKYELKKE